MNVITIQSMGIETEINVKTIRKLVKVFYKSSSTVISGMIPTLPG